MFPLKRLLACLIVAGCATKEIPNCCALGEDALLRAAFDNPFGYDVEKPREHLALTPARATRMGDDLVLTLASAPRLVLHNDIRGCDEGTSHCDGYWLVADLPSRHFYLVREYYYEGGDYYLVDDRTGRKTSVGFVPAFSPDGQRFLVLDDDVANDHPNNLEIWRRDGDGAVLEWAHGVGKAEAETPGYQGLYRTKVLEWRGDSITLTFSTNEYLDTASKTIVPARTWTGRLSHQSKGWSLEASAPPFSR